MIHLDTVDIAVLVIFFASVLVAGFSVRRHRGEDEVGFLLAGRPLTLPLFVMTLVSTWYGGILGVGEYSYRFGISNWLVQGAPYYLFAALFAWFLAPRIRATNLLTIPDKLEQAYDRRTSLLGATLTFILVTPAPYILMLGTLFEMLFGWGLLPGMLVATGISVSYLFSGGFRADIRTDVVEFFFMFAGFGIILPFCVFGFGGIGFLEANLPPLHLTWHGGNSPQYLLVWMFIALWTFVDPAFHQRCYAAKDARTARGGILVSIAFWFAFDFLTAAAGLYARAIVPSLDQPIMAYPMLAETVLPPLAKGLFFAGILATIMSTLNTVSFVSAQTLGRDIVLRYLTGRDLSTRTRDGAPNGAGTKAGELPSPRNPVFYTRAGLALALLLSIPFALLVPSVIGIWYAVGTVTIPGLIVPVILSYSTKWAIRPGYAFYSMLSGWLGSTLWWLGGLAGGESAGVLLGIEPIYPGLALSVLTAGAGLGLRKDPQRGAGSQT